MPSKNYPPHEFFPEPFLHMHITHSQQGSTMYQPRIEDEQSALRADSSTFTP
jgi:hypothetical protein